MCQTCPVFEGTVAIENLNYMYECVYDSGYNVHSNISYQIVEAFEMMIVTILSAAVKCQWDLKPYQEAMITTVTLNLM